MKNFLSYKNEFTSFNSRSYEIKFLYLYINKNKGYAFKDGNGTKMTSYMVKFSNYILEI